MSNENHVKYNFVVYTQLHLRSSISRLHYHLRCFLTLANCHRLLCIISISMSMFLMEEVNGPLADKCFQSNTSFTHLNKESFIFSDRKSVSQWWSGKNICFCFYTYKYLQVPFWMSREHLIFIATSTTRESSGIVCVVQRWRLFFALFIFPFLLVFYSSNKYLLAICTSLDNLRHML